VDVDAKSHALHGMLGSDHAGEGENARAKISYAASSPAVRRRSFAIK
jgi:hypothetical protein